MSNLFEPPKIISVPLSNEPDLRFPVNRIYCIGLNYLAHAQEVYESTDKAHKFFFFTKTRDAILHNHGSIAYPMQTSSFQHEVELVIAIGKTGKCIATQDVEKHIYGFATGIDFTRRDLQKQLSHAGLPWDAGKVFDHSAGIGAITPLSMTHGLLNEGEISLKVNGEVKQKANLSAMLFKVRDIVAQLSHYNTLYQGDIIYTGTPHGSTNLEVGDKLTAHIDMLEDLHVDVIAG